MTHVEVPQNLRLMRIVAHPHDVTYTLGTSAHHIERGDTVTVVSLTDGVTTHNEELEDEMRKPEAERDPEILNRPRSDQAERKQQELARVCGLFGIEDVRVLPFADNPLDASLEVLRTLVQIFYEVRPHIVITHAPYDYRIEITSVSSTTTTRIPVLLPPRRCSGSPSRTSIARMRRTKWPWSIT